MPKRLGLILVAIAFLAAGMPRLSLFNLAVRSVAASETHTHGMPGADQAQHSGDHCAIPDGKAPACEHSHDCLACTSVAFPAVARTALSLHWTRVDFPEAEPQFSGVTPPPEVFPPIPQF